MISWSGGKDSALALHNVSSKGRKILGLLTTLTSDFERISMHGVRRSLLLAQGRALDLNLEEVWIPKDATNTIYEKRFAEKVLKYRAPVIFGDLFLEDIRRYRENLFRRLGVRAEFPLWGRDTKKLAEQFIELGFGALVCTVDPRKLGWEFCGREFDYSFLRDLPEGVDPCGENGEFHTFVYKGPIFRIEIGVTRGEIVLRDGFYFCDIMPKR